MNTEAISGLTEYELKLYRALLQVHPATAYRLGRLSGVPLSRVNEVAERLVAKGAAARLTGEPARYAPVPPEQFVARARAAADEALAALQEELAAVWRQHTPAESVWLQGEATLLATMRDLASRAGDELSAACTPADEALLRRLLPGARIERLAGGGRDDRTILLLADDGPALIGRLGRQADALVSHHPAVVRVCRALVESLRSTAVEQSLGQVAVVRTSLASERPGIWLDWEEAKAQRLLNAH